MNLADIKALLLKEVGKLYLDRDGKVWRVKNIQTTGLINFVELSEDNTVAVHKNIHIFDDELQNFFRLRTK